MFDGIKTALNSASDPLKPKEVIREKYRKLSANRDSIDYKDKYNALKQAIKESAVLIATNHDYVILNKVKLSKEVFQMYLDQEKVADDVEAEKLNRIEDKLDKALEK